MVAYFSYSQSTEKWKDWTFRTISQRQAENLVAAGEARPITRMRDGIVQVVGFRATKPTSWERESPATLTYATMVAVGNDGGGVPADPRYRQTRREREEVTKFRVWALIGDTKAVAVRPRITEAERELAEKLLKPSTRRCRGFQAA
jgi:hypothetical protein